MRKLLWSAAVVILLIACFFIQHEDSTISSYIFTIPAVAFFMGIDPGPITLLQWTMKPVYEHYGLAGAAWIITLVLFAMSVAIAMLLTGERQKTLIDMAKIIAGVWSGITIGQLGRPSNSVSGSTN